MQSKLFDFSIDGNGKAQLFGDFGALKPITVDGIAHAFERDGNTTLTLYSVTGLDTSVGTICSAEVRLALSKRALESLHNQIGQLLASSGDAHHEKKRTDDEKSPSSTNQTLSDPL